MSSGKNIGVTVNQSVSTQMFRAAQAASRATIAGMKSAKGAAERAYANKQVKAQHIEYSKLCNELDTAKKQYACLNYHLPDLPSLPNNATLAQMRSWVKQSQTTLSSKTIEVNNAINTAKVQHQATLKKIATWKQLKDTHACLINQHRALTQLKEQGGNVQRSSIPSLPNESATQKQLNQVLSQFKSQSQQLQHQITQVRKQVNMQQQIQKQVGAQVTAVGADQRLNDAELEQRRVLTQQLEEFVTQEKARLNMNNIPNHVKLMIENHSTNQSMNELKANIKEALIKENKINTIHEQAIAMLNNPPENATNNLELAKRWQSLVNSLQQGMINKSNAFYLQGFARLIKEYQLLQDLNQRLLDDAHITVCLEEALAKSGLAVASDGKNAMIYSPNSDDAVVAAKRVDTDKGVVLQTQQVFADDLNDQEIKKISNDLCDKMAKAVNQTPQADSQHRNHKQTMKSAIKPSKDDGKIVKRRREFIRRQQQQKRQRSF